MATRASIRALLALASLSAIAGCGEKTGMTVAPISTSGTVQTTVVSRRDTSGRTEHSIQQNVGVAADSYVWQPWFARVNGTGDISYEKKFGDESGSSLRGSGSATLSVLPLSRYPVTIGLSHFDNRVSGDFASSDFTRDRASINARAVLTQNLRSGLNASWQRTDREDSGLLESRNVGIDLMQTFAKEDAFLGINSIGLGLTYRDTAFTAEDPAEEDRDRKVASATLTMRSEPMENLTYDSLVTATYDDLDEESEAFTRSSLQGVTTLQWRPDDQPFVVTGSLRTLVEQIDEVDEGVEADSRTTLATGTLGIRWPVNDRLSTSFGIRAGYENISRDEGADLGETDLREGARVVAGFLADADYLSESQPLGGFDWRWDARVHTDNGIESDEGFVSRDSITVGHRFERRFEDLIFVPFRFSFDQDLDVTYDTGSEDDSFSVGISNALSLDYSHAEATSSTFAQIVLRDSRNFIGEERELQLLQARFSRQVTVDRDRRLQGSITAQAVREVSDGETDSLLTASGSVSYQHRNLFDVDNLGFRSELRISIVNIDELFGDSADEFEPDTFRNDWRNILTYRIGRLTAELEATAFHRDDGLGYLGLVRLRRDFSGGD